MFAFFETIDPFVEGDDVDSLSESMEYLGMNQFLTVVYATFFSALE